MVEYERLGGVVYRGTIGTPGGPASVSPSVAPRAAPAAGAAGRGGAGVKSTSVVPYFPPNAGFLGTPKTTTLRPGQKISRFGPPSGTYASPAGTPAAARALPPGSAKKELVYVVVKPLPVQAGTAAPWFNQLGLGTQYKLPMSVSKLLDRGIIKKAHK